MKHASALPEVVPVFPLAGALLLPRAMLPLHIFEPRYRAMVRDSLLGDGLIGMIQPLRGGDDTNPPVFDIGCLGKIIGSKSLDDGRYLISLQGVSRFRVSEELAPHEEGYRRVRADYADFRGDLDGRRGGPIDREALIKGLVRYFDRRDVGADMKAIRRADDETLVNVLCMACPFADNEKQALLECEGTVERAGMLVTLFAMSRFGAADGDGPARMN